MPSSYPPSKPQCSFFIHGKGKSICTCPFHNDDDSSSPSTLLSLLPISAHPHTSKLPSATPAENSPLSTFTPSPTQSMLSNPLVQNFMNAFALATVPATVNMAAGQKGEGKEMIDGVKTEKKVAMEYKLDVSELDNMPPMIIEYITI